MISLWLEQKLKVWELVVWKGGEILLRRCCISYSSEKPLYRFLDAFEVSLILLEVAEGLLHQTVQIQLVAELQLRISLQHDGHHHQQLLPQWRQDTHRLRINFNFFCIAQYHK